MKITGTNSIYMIKVIKKMDVLKQGEKLRKKE